MPPHLCSTTPNNLKPTPMPPCIHVHYPLPTQARLQTPNPTLQDNSYITTFMIIPTNPTQDSHQQSGPTHPIHVHYPLPTQARLQSPKPTCKIIPTIPRINPTNPMHDSQQQSGPTQPSLLSSAHTAPHTYAKGPLSPFTFPLCPFPPHQDEMPPMQTCHYNSYKNPPTN